VAAIVPHERVVVASQVPDVTRAKLREAVGEALWKQIMVEDVPCNDTWTRDFGPLTLTCPGRENVLLDFRFNGWGEKFEADLDNEISHTLYNRGVFRGVMQPHRDFVLEGGAVESDGRGTVFTTSQCLLAPHRNEPLSKDEIEKELLRRLMADRIVWLNHGRLIGDDTDGHIDTIVRVAPDDTLLYIRCTDQTDEHYSDFAQLEAELRALRTASGSEYRLIALPMARQETHDGERLPATYANFLVINGAVICPTYDNPPLDEAAFAALGEAFPDRKIIGADARIIIRQHGSVHCLTMQLPASTLNMDYFNTHSGL